MFVFFFYGLVVLYLLGFGVFVVGGFVDGCLVGGGKCVGGMFLLFFVIVMLV